MATFGVELEQGVDSKKRGLKQTVDANKAWTRTMRAIQKVATFGGELEQGVDSNKAWTRTKRGLESVDGLGEVLARPRQGLIVLLKFFFVPAGVTSSPFFWLRTAHCSSTRRSNSPVI